MSMRIKVGVHAEGINPWGIAADPVEDLDIIEVGGLDDAESVALLRGQATVLVIDGFVSGVRAETLVSSIAPRLVLRVVRSDDTSSWGTGVFEGLERPWSVSLEQESFGSPFIGRYRVQCYSTFRSAPPVRTHGPAAPSSEGLVAQLWDSKVFIRRGIPTDRANIEVARQVSRGIKGEAALVIQPGFASLLPRAAVTLPTAEGDVSGALCASPVEPGQFVILRSLDISELLGYEGLETDWETARSLMAVPFARALLTWIRDRLRAM